MDELKHIYKNSLTNHSIHEEGGEWIALDKKLIRINFFRFNVFRFNIYYATAILLTTVSTLAFLLDRPKESNIKQIRSEKLIVKTAPAIENHKEEITHIISKLNQKTSLSNPVDQSQPLGIDEIENRLGDKKNTQKDQFNATASQNKKVKNERASKMNLNATDIIPKEFKQADSINNNSRFNKDTYYFTAGEKTITDSENSYKKSNVRTIYVSKRDTIISYDSIKVNPRKLRKQNKALN